MWGPSRPSARANVRLTSKHIPRCGWAELLVLIHCGSPHFVLAVRALSGGVGVALGERVAVLFDVLR